MGSIVKKIFEILYVVSLLFVVASCINDFIENNSEADINKSTNLTRGGCNSSPYYFHDHNGEKIYLSLNTEYAFLSAKESHLPEDIVERGVKATEFKSDKSNIIRYSTKLSFEKGLSDKQYLELLSNIKTKNKDVIISPYFNDQYGSKIGLSNFFYVKLKNASDAALLEQTAMQFDCVIVNQDSSMPLWFTLSVTESSEFSALECANFFHESDFFAVGEPALMADIYFSANDEYFPQQWGLKNTGHYGGAAGIDINVSDAWSISTGENITVAVIDQGIDLGHADLFANIHSSSYDCQSATFPQILTGKHGTACAGIIGAARNNSVGIAGVAADCMLMSISHDLYASANIRQQLAAGINWAWKNGADVISNSWGHQTALSGSYITDAIHNAVTYGRGGKGCVVVFASGNDNLSPVSYPARLSDVIAVGAISFNGRRKSLSTPDGEGWGSNYGTELNVVAPGVLIPTTDIRGGAGYNPNVPIHLRTGGNVLSSDYSDQDYTIWFNGTSSACPHVAGIAALILSVNPDLSQRQVTDIIESTARKVGGYSYSVQSGRPNGTWNNEMGYGLVDAYQALLAAESAAQYITYIDQTVTGDVTISGLEITASNVTVKDGGKLTLQAPLITIDAPFTVEAGATLVLAQ